MENLLISNHNMNHLTEGEMEMILKILNDKLWEYLYQ